MRNAFLWKMQKESKHPKGSEEVPEEDSRTKDKLMDQKGLTGPQGKKLTWVLLPTGPLRKIEPQKKGEDRVGALETGVWWWGRTVQGWNYREKKCESRLSSGKGQKEFRRKAGGKRDFEEPNLPATTGKIASRRHQ